MCRVSGFGAVVFDSGTGWGLCSLVLRAVECSFGFSLRVYSQLDLLLGPHAKNALVLACFAAVLLRRFIDEPHTLLYCPHATGQTMKSSRGQCPCKTKDHGAEHLIYIYEQIPK